MKTLLTAAFVGAAAAATALQGSCDPVSFADAEHTYRFLVPDGCDVAKSPHGNPYIQCGNAGAAVTRIAGPATPAKLKSLIESITNEWRNRHVVGTAADIGTLGGENTLRGQVEGVEPNGVKADALFISAIHENSWVVFIFIAPSDEFKAGDERYFEPMQKSFEFTGTAG